MLYWSAEGSLGFTDHSLALRSHELPTTVCLNTTVQPGGGEGGGDDGGGGEGGGGEGGDGGGDGSGGGGEGG